MPRKRLVRTQIPKPLEESEETNTNGEGSVPEKEEPQPADGCTTAETSRSEPVTAAPESLSQLSTPRRRSRRTPAETPPAEEENSINSETLNAKEAVKEVGSDRMLRTPVIRLTRVSRRTVSPQKVDVEVTSQEDEKNNETPLAEVKETVIEEVQEVKETVTEVKETGRGRRARGGPRTKSPGKAIEKNEDIDTTTVVDIEADKAQVEPVVNDSSDNVEEVNLLQFVKDEDSNMKGAKSPRTLKRKTLWKSPKPEKTEPDFEAKDVTNLKIDKHVELNKELKASSTLDIEEMIGKETVVAEVKIPVPSDIEEKMECDYPEKSELCIPDTKVEDTERDGTAVKIQVDEEAPSQSQEILINTPSKTARGRRILRRGTGKENFGTQESKNTTDVTDEAESQCTEIVKGTPSRTVKGRKGMTEVEGKGAILAPESKVSIKIEPGLQETETIEVDKTEAKVFVNKEVKEELSKVGAIKKSVVHKTVVKDPIEVSKANSLEKMETEITTESPCLEKLKDAVSVTPHCKEEVKAPLKSKMDTVKVVAAQKPAIKREKVQKPAVKRDAVREIVEVPSDVIAEKMEVEDTIKSHATEKVKDVVRSAPEHTKKIRNDANKISLEDAPTKVTLHDKPDKEAVDSKVNKEAGDDKANKDVVEDAPNKDSFEDTANKEAEDTCETSDEMNFEEFIELDGVDNFDETDNVEDVPDSEKDLSIIDGEELDYEVPDENLDDDVSSLDADELLIIEDDAEYRSLFDEEINALEEARTQNKLAKGKDQEKKRGFQGGKTDEKGKKGDASKSSVDDKRKKDNDQTRRKTPESRGRRNRSRTKRKNPESKDRKSPESRSRKTSPDSRSRRKSLESRDKRKSPSDSRDKRKSPSDSRDKKKSPSDSRDKRKSPSDSRDKRKSPSDSKDKRKSPSDSRDKRKSPPNSKEKSKVSQADKSRNGSNESKRKNADQDKKKDSQSRSDRKRSKSPSKADSKKDHAAGYTLQIRPKSDVKKSNTFRQVVLLANSLYKNQLKGVESTYVKVIYEDSLSSETLVHLIQKYRKDYGRNTLWMLLAGIYTFIEDEKAASCRGCKDPLRIIVKSNQNNVNIVDCIMHLCRLTCDTVQRRLGSEALITFAPPLPAPLAITDQYNTHRKLHSAAEGHNLIATKVTYEKVRKRYNVFCREWIKQACERNESWINVDAFKEYRDSGEANLFPMFSKDRFDTRMKKWFEVMEKFINLVLETPFPSGRILGKLIPSHKEDIREEPTVDEPETETFTKVVVVGNTSFTKDLQDLTKHLNVEHLNENIDFDEGGLAFLNELQKKHPSRTLWVVLSGVSEVAEPDDSGPPKCKILNCENPIPVFVTKNDNAGDPDFKGMNIDQMVNGIVKDAFSFATLATNNLKEESGIFLAPIMPLCAIWSGHATLHSHEAIHRMYKRNPNVPHFVGLASTWIRSAKALEIKWLDKIMSSLKKDSQSYEIMKNYREEKPPVLEYVEDVTVPKVKQVQKTWSKMMAKMLQCYLVGSETKAVLEAASIKTPGLEAELVPTGVSHVVAGVPLDHQASLNGVATGVVYPHGTAPVGYTYPEADLLINSQFSSMGVQALPMVVGASPQVTASFQGALAYPGPTQAIAYHGAGFQGFQAAASQDPYYGCWTTPVNPSITAAASAFAPSVPVAPVSATLPAATGTCTIQAAPKLKTPVKGHLVIQNVETDMNESQARSLLQEFGEMGEMKWPLNQKDQPARFLMINYKQRKHAERAERILNYLKVFGDNSQVKLIGADVKSKEGENKLESEDLELLLGIHEVLERIKKESKMNKPQPTPLFPQLSQNRSGPVVAGTVGPVQVPATPVLTIVVSNFTDIVPVKDVNEMFVELGASGKGVLIQNALHFTFKGEPAVINLLSGFRFPDKKMEVTVKSAINEPRLTNKALQEAKAKMEEPLSKLLKKIENVLKEKIDEEINVYTFKTRLCRYGDGCKAKDLCPKFHDAGDRRRSLVLFQYSDEMCTDLEESGSCAAKDKCFGAHSPVEILFHFKNFRSSICPGWQQNRACDKVGRVCSYVHPGTPEMLYNEKWDDVYVDGLKRTLDYLIEAIKNLFLVKDLQCLRVLLVTTTPEMAKLYVDCVAELAKICNQKVSQLVGDAVPEGTTVLITTVDALRPLLNASKPQQPKKLDSSRLKALILDDGPALLKHCPKYMQNYFAELSRKDVNIVVTAEKLLKTDVEDARNKIRPKAGFQKIFPVSSKKKGSKQLSSAKPGSYRNDVLERLISSTWAVDPNSTQKNAQENQSSKDRMEKGLENMSSLKEKTSARGAGSRSFSLNYSSSSTQKLDDRVKALASLEIEYKKTLTELEKEQERQLELYISSPEFHPEYEQKYSIFMEQYKVQYPERTDMDHSNKLWEEFWKELITLLLQEEYDVKKQTLEKEYKEKKEKSSILSQDSRNKENEQDEDKQERRSNESQKRKSTDDRDSHQEKYRRDETSSDVARGRMNQNRNEGNDIGKGNQYNRNEELSRDSYGRGQQYRAHEEKSSRFDGLQQKSNKEEFGRDTMQQSNLPIDNSEKNDMGEAVSLLQELCPSLGVLGPAAHLLMRKVSNCGSDMQQLSKLVQDEDNKMILKRLSEKALGVSQMYGSGAQAMKLRSASTQALKLMNMASVPSESQKYYGLDIENIAKLTYNMDPAYIVQCIKNALNTKGIINASESDVTDIYVAVTSAHFGIAYNKSGGMSQLKTQDNGQSENRSLKRERPGWKDEEVSKAKRCEGSWSGKEFGGNSRDFSQGRQSGVRDEYGAFGSGKSFNREGDVNAWNAKTSDTMNAPVKINYGHQKSDFSQPKVTDYGHQSSTSYSTGLDIGSSNVEFNRLANLSSLSGSLNSGAQVSKMPSGDHVTSRFNQRGGSFSQGRNQMRDNYKQRGNQMGGTFSQRADQMRGNSSGQKEKELSLVEFLSQW